MKKCLVQLADYKWYEAEIIGTSSAIDYDGERYDVKLMETGDIFRECHKNCIQKGEISND